MNHGNNLNEEGDNSSSGVSSDQVSTITFSIIREKFYFIFVLFQKENGGNGKFVTYLPVEGVVNPSSNQSILPDNVSESSDDVSEKSWVLRAEQDPMGRSIISMKKMLHPKLQAIFDAPPVNQNKNSNLMTSSAGTSMLHKHLVTEVKFRKTQLKRKKNYLFFL